jgi:hypothetical protein
MGAISRASVGAENAYLSQVQNERSINFSRVDGATLIFQKPISYDDIIVEYEIYAVYDDNGNPHFL